MPLRLFASRNVTGANLVMAFLVVGFFGMFFLGALYLQGIQGYNPLEVGLAFLPSCIIMGTLSLGYAEKLVIGFGARRSLITGLVLALAGLLMFVRTTVDGSYWTEVFPVMVLLGLGAGICFPALMTLAMSGATQEDAGLASGLINTTTQVGGAIGLAVLATVSTERSDSLQAAGETVDSALNSGYHLAYLIGAGLMAAAVAVAVFIVERDPARGRGHAEHGHDDAPRRGLAASRRTPTPAEAQAVGMPARRERPGGQRRPGSPANQRRAIRSAARPGEQRADVAEREQDAGGRADLEVGGGRALAVDRRRRRRTRRSGRASPAGRRGPRRAARPRSGGTSTTRGRSGSRSRCRRGRAAPAPPNVPIASGRKCIAPHGSRRPRSWNSSSPQRSASRTASASGSGIERPARARAPRAARGSPASRGPARRRRASRARCPRSTP